MRFRNFLAESKDEGELVAALEETGRIDEAIRHYEEALRLKPDSPEARNNLARALGSRKPPAGR